MRHVAERVRAMGGRDWTATCYSDMLYCAPARASLLTGRYPHNHGILGNWDAWKKYKANRYFESDLFARMTNSGYRVGVFGKVINTFG